MNDNPCMNEHDEAGAEEMDTFSTLFSYLMYLQSCTKRMGPPALNPKTSIKQLYRNRERPIAFGLYA